LAGQHEPYLNVRGVDVVGRAVARCSLSLYAPHALAYRREHGIAVAGARLAVLVQRLVRADASAVVFSANPVTKHDAPGRYPESHAGHSCWLAGASTRAIRSWANALIS
jgi:phosphoenolpyruvate synthase/pyruvate phosphate dikinase